MRNSRIAEPLRSIINAATPQVFGPLEIETVRQWHEDRAQFHREAATYYRKQNSAGLTKAAEERDTAALKHDGFALACSIVSAIRDRQIVQLRAIQDQCIVRAGLPATVLYARLSTIEDMCAVLIQSLDR